GRLGPRRDRAGDVRVPQVRRAVRTRGYRVPRANATGQGLAMPGQRRGEPGHDARRRSRGRARVALIAVIAAAAATGACPPGGLGGGAGFLGGGTGGGGGRGGPSPGATQLLGSGRKTRRSEEHTSELL